MAPSRDIDIDEDMQFQRRNWLAERIGWAGMALVIAAALLGLFGSGPLSWTTLHGDDGAVRLEYGRFQRLSAPTNIRITVTARSSERSGWRVEVDRNFLNAFRIENIWPQPVQSAGLPQGLRFEFAASEGATIVFNVTPEKIGFVRPSIAVASRDPIALPLFVYP